MYRVTLQLPDTFDRLLEDHLVDLAAEMDARSPQSWSRRAAILVELSTVITADVRRVYVATLLGAIAANLGRDDVAAEITRLNQLSTH